MSEVDNVTFVGGKAIEQHESLESTTLEGDERSAALAAVKEAIEKAGKESAEDAKSDKAKDPFKPAGTVKEEPKARGEDGKFLPKKEVEEKPEEDFDPTKASVKQLLKNREKVAQAKKASVDEASKLQAELEARQRAFFDQQRQFQAEQERFRREQETWKNLKKDPGRAIREAGYDPEQFILDLAQEGTPEGQAAKKQRELEETIRSLKAWQEDLQKGADTWAQKQRQAQEAQQRQHLEQTFLGLAYNEERFPHVAAFYKGKDRLILAEGDTIADEFRTLSGGREATLEDILDHIEDELAEKATNWYSKTNKVVKQAPTPQPSVPKSKGKQLSPQISSERVSLSSKELKDLDSDERYEAAKQAVKVALAASAE
jgi:hypothetical protein